MIIITITTSSTNNNPVLGTTIVTGPFSVLRLKKFDSLQYTIKSHKRLRTPVGHENIAITKSVL